jgi:hypothetical protein
VGNVQQISRPPAIPPKDVHHGKDKILIHYYFKNKYHDLS